LQNAIGDVTELLYIKKIGDQDVAKGHPALTYDSYMELLLVACSTYDKKLSLPGKQKLAIYKTEIDQHDNTYYLFDDTYNGVYEAYRVDTDISEIMANVSDTNRYGSISNLGKTQSTFLPRNEWDKLSQEQKDQLIAKQRQEQMNQNSYKSKSSHATCQANTHCVADTVNIDDIIDYAVNNHERGTNAPNDILKESDSDIPYLHIWLDVPRLLVTFVNSLLKITIQIRVFGETTYFLNKGETIKFNGQQYSALVTLVHYCFGEHDVASMDQALVDHGANGGIYGEDMRVLEGSERFVDVFGLAGHKVSQLRIVTAQALVSTHKGDAIATFHQMALLGKGKSILSCLQMEAFGANIND
jgi:hypothetical protein